MPQLSRDAAEFLLDQAVLNGRKDLRATRLVVVGLFGLAVAGYAFCLASEGAYDEWIVGVASTLLAGGLPQWNQLRGLQKDLRRLETTRTMLDRFGNADVPDILDFQKALGG